jgi:hypothetical protein
MGAVNLSSGVFGYVGIDQSDVLSYLEDEEGAVEGGDPLSAMVNQRLPGDSASYVSYLVATIWRGPAASSSGDAGKLVPPSRWDVEQAGSTEVLSKRVGSFVQGAELFDDSFFALSTQEVGAFGSKRRVLCHVRFVEQSHSILCRPVQWTHSSGSYLKLAGKPLGTALYMIAASMVFVVHLVLLVWRSALVTTSIFLTLFTRA